MEPDLDPVAHNMSLNKCISIGNRAIWRLDLAAAAALVKIVPVDVQEADHWVDYK